MQQNTGLKRKTIDKFYTNSDIVNNCIDLVKKNVSFEKNDLIIEPSAGNGSFIYNIEDICIKENITSLYYDIEPENEKIIKQDFLLLDTLNLEQKYNNIHVIGNPPFGRQSSFAIKFIKKCCLFSKSISFILPKSFKKDSLKKCFDNYFHCIIQYDLPNNSFVINNKIVNVPCVFQIWVKQKIIRNIKTKESPYNFIFVKKNENPDISFRRVGGTAGKITRVIDDKNIQSHYFIKFTNKFSIDENLKLLSNIKFDNNNTVGPKSISKTEIIIQFNEILKKV
jgi:hypothetical protein